MDTGLFLFGCLKIWGGETPDAQNLLLVFLTCEDE